MEETNICNLPNPVTIKVHQSEKTGKYYIDFIEFITSKLGSHWKSREITEDDVRKIIDFLYAGELIDE